MDSTCLSKKCSDLLRLPAKMALDSVWTPRQSTRIGAEYVGECKDLQYGRWWGALNTAWTEGCKLAELILREHFIPVDFVTVFMELDVDTLRPHPGGIYPGISTDPNHSIEPVIGLEPTATVNLAESSPDDDQDAPEDDLDIGLADILDELPAPPEFMVQAGDDWLEHEGQKYHKASLLHIMFCSGFMRKSKECLERVQDYTAVSIKPSVNQDNKSLLNIAVFMVGDLFTSLVQTGKTILLAVLQSTCIDHNSHKVSAISTAELEVEKSNTTLSG